MSDYEFQARLWTKDSMFYQPGEADLEKVHQKYHVINLVAYPKYRLGVWQVHVFYDGYKMPGIKGEIYRVDAELPFGEFSGKSALDVVEYCQQYVDRDIVKFKEDNE